MCFPVTILSFSQIPLNDWEFDYLGFEHTRWLLFDKCVVRIQWIDTWSEQRYLKPNRKIVKRDKIDTPSIQMYDRPFSCFSKGTSIYSDEFYEIVTKWINTFVTSLIRNEGILIRISNLWNRTKTGQVKSLK